MNKSMYKVVEGSADLNLIVKVTIKSDVNLTNGGVVDIYTNTRPKNIITQIQLKSDYDVSYKSSPCISPNDLNKSLDKIINTWLGEQAVIANNQSIWTDKLKLLGFE